MALPAHGPGVPLIYLAVALTAGAIIALQICIMRQLAITSWVHFGSLVVSLAMMAFGLVSAVFCVETPMLRRRARVLTRVVLIAFGPATIIACALAQNVPFNAIFIASDPAQKWCLALRLALYIVPFLLGAVFLAAVFVAAGEQFPRVYFADLAGSGACAALLFGAMASIAPGSLILVPVALWAAGALLWFLAWWDRAGAALALISAVVAALLHLALLPALGIQTLLVSEFKSISHARNLPDARRVYVDQSAFGSIEAYASSYLHFAPGLSDNAAFNIGVLPANVFAGLYIDGDGPIGVMRRLRRDETQYFRYLPMFMPYLLKAEPRTLVIQSGGGLSTALALYAGAGRVTVAEPNPAMLRALRTDRALRDFTGNILGGDRVRVVADAAHLYLAQSNDRFDVIDLSLIDSVGLANPGGFAVVEKFAYSREAFERYMAALAPGGVLAVTIWNREEPPKSVLKLYATIAEAARRTDGGDIGARFFVVSSYLSTATVLYKRGGLSEDEVARLRSHAAEMSFDEIYAPEMAIERDRWTALAADYRQKVFPSPGEPRNAEAPRNAAMPAKAQAAEPARDAEMLPAVRLGRLVWAALIAGDWWRFADAYVFDTRELTNSRPYFSAYVKPGDLRLAADHLAMLQDEWGYLVVWATFGLACTAASVLVLVPLAIGWRGVFGAMPGKAGTLVYFACLGLGYIVVEVALISYLVLVLASPTVSVLLVLPSMLIFSGFGSLFSERILGNARRVMPGVLLAVAAVLLLYAISLDSVLEWIGRAGHLGRIGLCVLILFPPAFLMGLPMPTAMSWLSRLGKESLLVWGWGINGCFSVVGSALVPLLATSFGLSAALATAGCAYLVAAFAFSAVMRPVRVLPATAAVAGHGGHG
jgi:SAM-dependent methyltransferase